MVQFCPARLAKEPLSPYGAVRHAVCWRMVSTGGTTMRNRSVLLATPLLVAGVLIGASSTANASLPVGVTHVGVSAGATHAGIDGHLHPAASISGTITALSG